MAILLPLHVAISFIGLGSGLVVLAGLLRGQRLDGWTALFLGSTLLTSLSGFPLPADHLLPSHIVGVISVVVLVLAIVARYPRAWRDPGARSTSSPLSSPSTSMSSSPSCKRSSRCRP